MTNPLHRWVPTHVCINGFTYGISVITQQGCFCVRDCCCCCRETNPSEVGSGLGGPGSASVIVPVPASRVCGLLPGWPPHPACFCWQNMPLSSLDIVSLCSLDYYFTLFLFLKAFEANGSSKGCSARNVFVTIKGCFTQMTGRGLVGRELICCRCIAICCCKV